MKRIRKIWICGIVLVGFFLGGKDLYAQQDPAYTQYMDNLLVINPAYAGSREIGNSLLVARNQWVSFDGAPTARSFAYNTSFEKKKVGFGFSVLTDKIGPLKQTGVYADYSYFLQVSDEFKLGMGLKGGVSFYRANLTDLETVESDPLFDNDIYENFLPNVGVGFYLFSDNTFLGLSVPKLIENRITKESVSSEYVNRQEIHLYLAGGHRFDLNDNIQLKPCAMAKWVRNTPLSVDISLLVGFKQKFWVGAMYRFDEAYGIIAQFRPTSKMRIGYSYDISISELSGYNNGSHEILFSYDIDLFERRSKSQPVAYRGR